MSWGTTAELSSYFWRLNYAARQCLPLWVPGSAGSSLLLKGQWAAVGKPDHFSGLLIIIIFISVEIIWYIADVCSSLSIILHSAVPSAPSGAGSGPAGTRPQTTTCCPVFIFGWLFELLLSCQFTDYGLQDTCLPELLYNITDPTNLESVRLYQEFVVLYPLPYSSHQKQYIQKAMLFQTYMA